MADKKDEGKKRTCKNPPCGCRVPEGEDFCSVNCASTEHETQIDCDCGHPECGGDF